MYKLLNIEICNSQTLDIYPQVEHMGANYPWSSANSIENIISNKSLGFIPNLHSFHLNDDTIPTDIISQSYIYTSGLLGSKQFCNTISHYNVQNYEKFPAQVIYHGKSLNYYWLHFIEDIEKYLNLSKCCFVLSLCNGNKKIIKINSIVELRDMEKKIISSGTGSFEVKDISFVPETPQYDLFNLCLQGNRYFVSDRLVTEILSGGFTGFELDMNIEVNFE